MDRRSAAAYWGGWLINFSDLGEFNDSHTLDEVCTLG
jgi:hypothetical protein